MKFTEMDSLSSSNAKNADLINDVKKLYGILNQIVENAGGIRIFKDCDGKMYWPEKGVYFILDFDETDKYTGFCPRIVRIGTHQIRKNSKVTLWERLKQHKGTDEGYGNHRASSFRKDVGIAIIEDQKSKCDTWKGKKNPKNDELKNKETAIEKKVSDYVAKLGIVVISINDESSKESDRAFIEKNTIALIAEANRKFDTISEKWLGREHTSDKINKTFLWNKDHVNYKFSEREKYFNTLRKYVESTIEEWKKQAKDSR
ncbi:hypothetical protein LQZ19_00390 [Treponema primitia]|uniref:hypothetical protein n=1 Tax=Treponema primitia TaxID=88058 RepID=UPI00397EE526